MDENKTSQSWTPMARRVVFWNAAIVGFAGWILAISGAMSGDFVGVGLCLAASALASGVIGHTFLRK